MSRNTVYWPNYRYSTEYGLELGSRLVIPILYYEKGPSCNKCAGCF
jgi:hypothetical protein